MSMAEMTSTICVSAGITLDELDRHLTGLLHGGFDPKAPVTFRVQHNMHERYNTPMAPTVTMAVTHSE